MSNSSAVTLPGTDRNVSDLLRAAAAAHPERVALAGAFGRRTWGELEHAVSAGAAVLRAVTTPGDRMLVRLPAGPEAVLAQFAVSRAGLIAAPLSPEPTRAGEAVSAAENLGAVGIIGPEVVGSVQFSEQDVTRWWTAAPVDVPSLGAGEDLAWLAGASSARPAMLSHRALLAAVRGVLSAPSLQLRTEDRAVQVLPLHHLSGWVTAFLPLAAVGGTAVLPSHAAPGEWTEGVLSVIREHRVTVIPAAPGLYRRLTHARGVERALSSVRLMTSAATPLDAGDLASLRITLGQSVWEGYGVSESASVVTTTLMTAAPRAGSVGLPVAGVELRILGDATDAADLTAGADQAADLVESRPSDPKTSDPKTSDPSSSDPSSSDPTSAEPVGAEPTESEDGAGTADRIAPAAGGSDADEVSAEASSESVTTEGVATEGVTTESVATEGVTAESVTAESLTDEPVDEPVVDEIGEIAVRGETLFSGYWPDGADGPDEDGWFVTGDIGYLDDRGELHLVDRAGESFSVAGFTVYPREVEDALTEHPYVRDASVVGIADRGTTRIVAVLVAQRGTRPTDDDLAEHLSTRLPSFKRPAEYVLVDRMPRTEVGRIDRRAVAALVDPTAQVASLSPKHARGADESDADLF